MKQLVRSLAVDLLNTAGEAGEFLWWCSNFWLFHLCIAHGIHNSFKMSLGDVLNDVQLMRAFWICVESLRNSVNVIFANLAPGSLTALLSQIGTLRFAGVYGPFSGLRMSG